MAFKTKIKCPICGGNAILSKAGMETMNGLIRIKDNPVYECQKCKETVASGEMVDRALEKARHQFNFERQIISTGGSLAITLPTDVSKYYRLSKGKTIQIIPQAKNEFRVITQKQ
ncbi:MAG: YgiT-type zinc finger protein [Candidatus Diapherotrites archaeon]|nr:YgiT-type zinc finger protein [Candidatus Diapherotrites archaeon]